MKILRTLNLIIGQFWISCAACLMLIVSSNTFAETAKSEKPPVTITAISYNVMYWHGFPADRVAMQGTPEHEAEEDIVRRVREQIPVRIALELALYAPDIISLQEARGEKNVKTIADKLGMNYAFFPRSERSNFPGAILTHYEILESQSRPVTDGDCPPDLFTRHWGRALLQTEIGKIAVHTAHLLPFGDRGAKVRGREITEMLKSIENDMAAGYTILLLGDLNHSHDTPEYARWVQAGLVDTWTQANKGKTGFTFPSTGPRSGREDHRIDYIWVDKQLADKLVHSRILYEGAFKTHADSVTSFAVSDHLPVLSIFKITTP